MGMGVGLLVGDLLVGEKVGLDTGPKVWLDIGGKFGGDVALGVEGREGFGAKVGPKVGTTKESGCFEVGAPVTNLLVRDIEGLDVG